MALRDCAVLCRKPRNKLSFDDNLEILREYEGDEFHLVSRPGQKHAAWTAALVVRSSSSFRLRAKAADRRDSGLR